MTDDQDIFDSDVPDEAPQTTEGVSPEAPVRDESGRFAPRDKGETEAAPAAPEDEPPASAEKPQSREIPITALLDEREKRQRAEARAALLERQIAAQQPKPELPDPMTDAEGYTRTLTDTFEQRLLNMRLEQSKWMAERDAAIGPDLFNEAMAWFETRPYDESAQFFKAASPFHAAVDYYRQQKAVEERGSPDFEEKLREKLRAELMAEMGQQQPLPASPPRPNVPRSLAAASGATAPDATAPARPSIFT